MGIGGYQSIPGQASAWWSQRCLCKLRGEPLVVPVARTLDELILITINHRSAPLKVVGKLENLVEQAYERLYPYTDELVILATCNRFEVYALESPRLLIEAESLLGDAAKYAVVLRGLDAARHLFRVAAGLESAILGENEILGQVAKAYESARSRGYAGKYMSLLFHYAVKTGKLVRSKTMISYGNVGAPGAAVHAAEKVLGSYDGRRVLVVGAGEAGSIIATLIRQKSSSARLMVVNRTYERAERLAKKVSGEAYSLDKLPELLEYADVVFVAVTVDKPLLTRDLLERMKHGALVVDVSNPSAVELPVPSHLGYIGLQGLEKVIQKTLERRRQEVPKAERIVEEQLALFRKAWMRRAADEAIAVMMEYAGRVVEEELQELHGRLRGLGVDGAALTATGDFAQSLVKKLLRPMIVYAHRAAVNGQAHVLEEIVEQFRREIEKRVTNRPERDSPPRNRLRCPP
ncbi:glutamyl-tRNA reductase [Pyrodictium delaneyi]|nr:glutamyl-tRNA reductase [Pyrodictium delaneyi]